MEIKIVKNILAENEVQAGHVRSYLKSKNQLMFNFMSAPGSGKTTLLEGLIPILQECGFKIGVIEGDIATQNDAQRLKHLGIPIAQINTEPFGGACHLSAPMIMGALENLNGYEIDVILIENVGNLVCPAEFDTGANANIVLLSVTEGEDKPLKYPLIFRVSHAAVISKIDIAGAAGANIKAIKENCLKINREISVFETSGKTGFGLRTIVDWITYLVLNKKQ